MHYPCSENKGADQRRSYCEADLRLCFRLCRLMVFSGCGYYVTGLIFLPDSIGYLVGTNAFPVLAKTYGRYVVHAFHQMSHVMRNPLDPILKPSKKAPQLVCILVFTQNTRFLMMRLKIAHIVSKMKDVNSDVKYYIMKPQISKVEC